MNGKRCFKIFILSIIFTQSLFSVHIYGHGTVVRKDTIPLYSNGIYRKSIYPQNSGDKGGFYNFLWGKHYRRLYTTPIQVTPVRLNNLHGGLNIVSQAPDKYGVFLENKDNHLYLLRILGGYSTFMESSFFRDIYNEREFNKTYLDVFIKDAYTITHPYSFLLADKMAGRLELNSFDPQIYYIPQQENEPDTLASGAKIEDRLVSIYDLKKYNLNSVVIDTDTLLKRIKEDKTIEIDENAYIRERLFNMLVGDWNKGNDSWRWEIKNNIDTVTVLSPVVIDRQSSFTKVDGFFFKGILGMFGLSSVSNYDYWYGNLKKTNGLSYNLDVALAGRAGREVWQKEAEYIKSVLTDEVIDEVFALLPEEVKDQESDQIKSKLKMRRNNIDQVADRYYDMLLQTPVIVATQGNDSIVLERKGRKELQVKMFNDEGRLVYNRVYDNRSKEIWLYGLEGNDKFILTGNSDKNIPLILIGGKGENTYDIDNNKRVTVYEYNSHEGENDNADGVKIVRTDIEKVHAYDFNKLKYSKIDFTPWGVYDSDLGLYLGAYASYTMYGFKRSPYSYRHRIGYNYLNGFMYQGLFPTLDEKRTYTIEAFMGTPGNFINFFGFGNETSRFKGQPKKYNRINVVRYSVNPSFNYTIDNNNRVSAQATFELYNIRKSYEKYVNDIYPEDHYFFKTKSFIDVGFNYRFNKELSSFVSLIDFNITPGWKINLRDTDRNFFYVKSDLGVNLSITDRLTFATQINGTILFSNKYEFYHAATTNLRGYRSNRFLGRRSFYQYSDLRLDLGRLENPFTPLLYGVFGGVDYGRVWYADEDSKKWHTSVGGGLWITLFKNYTGKFSYFSSKDGGRFEFSLGLDF